MDASCPTPELIRALFDGPRPPHSARSLLSHIEGCSACRDRLASLLPKAELPAPFLPDSYWNQPPATAPPDAETVGNTLPECVDLADCGFNDRRPAFDIPVRLGNYTILRVIGSGGMGLVFKALDPALNRFVAVKLMFPKSAADQSSRERFAREALSAARIASDHATAVYSVGEEAGSPYIVMEYVAGENLEARLNREGRLPIPVAVAIGRQIAAGLAAAHAEGVIHRDIKPGNVMLETLAEQDAAPCGSRIRVKITDFGIARSAGLPSITHAEETVGTPEYMSPEQISGEPLDHRSDLYSLGMLLYRMVTDKLPFDAKTSMAYFARHLYANPTPPTEHIADLPEWLGSLIMRLIRKEPSQRIQTAAEVVRLLDEGTLKFLGPPTDPEGKRLAALRSYRVLDTDAEQAFDDLTFLASHICGTPIALVSLIEEDRQWFKSKVGLSIAQTARNISFCQHTIRGTTPLVVGDAQADPRFADNPAVCQAPHVRFYAGVPLIDAEGCALGTLCVVDRVSKNLTPDQVSALAALGRLVMSQLAFRRELLERREAMETTV